LRKVLETAEELCYTCVGLPVFTKNEGQKSMLRRRTITPLHNTNATERFELYEKRMVF
jgi:hypothetical protein